MLTPIHTIPVPDPKPTGPFETQGLEKNDVFQNLKQLLGAADYDKAGERNAGLAAPDEATREAARSLLSELTLQYLYDHPLTDADGKIDSVQRVNYAIDLNVFREIADWTLGELKDALLRSDGKTIQRTGTGLTGVMVAALTKLLDTHELILLSKKINCTTKARTTLGLPGTLSSRLQPNHPTDDLRGISLLTYVGLSMGSGDALIGVNPAIDEVQNITQILQQLDRIRRQTKAPTQICVLGHVKTQLQCLRQGAPVEILFQSLAGTESTNLTEFDVSVDLLDEAYHTMRERGPLGNNAPNQLYFETGQGSEFTYGKHNGIDMTTLEALCYGLARRYQPFMVNNVTGFIGPETHADNMEMISSCLQDHFMGKLLGLPMGMAPCYTLHSKITLEGQQMATEMLTAAGANYYMDVYLNTDRMLAYFDTSSHDDQTLREIYNKKPTPEFLAWALEHEIFIESNGRIERGKQWGNPRQFCSLEELQSLREVTPSLYGFDNAGPRPSNQVSRQVRSEQAAARSAIYEELDPERIGGRDRFRWIETRAQSKEAHLNSPDLGAQIAPHSLPHLSAKQLPIQIVISDGLSAEAVHHNVGKLLPVLEDGLRAHQIALDKPILIPYGRVKLAEALAKKEECDLVLLLIGERPGGTALASRSLSCYYVYRLSDPTVQAAAAAFSGNASIEFEYHVQSNIYAGGLPPLEAGSLITETALQILEKQAAGNRLGQLA